MRRAIWTAWATVFGLLFALVFVTKFAAMFGGGRDWIVVGFEILYGVGFYACLKVARQFAPKHDRVR